MKDIKEKEGDIEYFKIFKETMRILFLNITFKIQSDKANQWLQGLVTYFDKLNKANNEDNAGHLKFSVIYWNVPE